MKTKGNDADFIIELVNYLLLFFT